MTTFFPQRARPNDPQHGYLTVQNNLETLRDGFDKHVGLHARGQATVIQGATTVAVSFPVSMSGVPQVSLTPRANAGGVWWASLITSSGFQINLAVAAPVGGVPFDWLALGV